MLIYVVNKKLGLFETLLLDMRENLGTDEVRELVDGLLEKINDYKQTYDYRRSRLGMMADEDAKREIDG